MLWPKRFLLFVFPCVFSLPCYPADVIFGRRVYAAEGRTYQQIWTLNTRARRTAPLTRTERRHVQPVCAADAKRIWFLSGAFGNDANTELWWFDAATRTEHLAAQFNGQITRLLGGTAGQAFFAGYETDAPAVYRWNGKLAKLTRIGSDAAALSPDARSLAVETGEPKEVTMMEASGALGRKIPNCSDPVWSADGRKLACAAGSTIRIVNLTTGVEAARIEFSQRTTPPAAADFSRDGTRLLVRTVGASHNSTSPQSDYWVLEIAAAKWTFVGPAQSAMFAPDGSVLLVTPRELAPVGKRQDWVSRLLIVDPATHAQTPVAAGTASNAEPSPCAQKVIVAAETQKAQKTKQPQKKQPR